MMTVMLLLNLSWSVRQACQLAQAQRHLSELQERQNAQSENILRIARWMATAGQR